MEQTSRMVPQAGPGADEIAEWIRSKIRASRFVPGQRLVEIDLIRATGGSRFKVREALQRLSAEGLVQIQENRGASVKEASLDEVRQLYRARAALEGICAGDFARLASNEEKQRLSEINREMEECVNEGSPERFSRLNVQWHAMIMEVSGNEVLADLVKRLHTPVHHLQFRTFYQGERLREAVNDHQEILKAILSDDPRAAEQAMRNHVEHGLRFLMGIDRNLHPET